MENRVEAKIKEKEKAETKFPRPLERIPRDYTMGFMALLNWGSISRCAI